MLSYFAYETHPGSDNFSFKNTSDYIRSFIMYFGGGKTNTVTRKWKQVEIGIKDRNNSKYEIWYPCSVPCPEQNICLLTPDAGSSATQEVSSSSEELSSSCSMTPKHSTGWESDEWTWWCLCVQLQSSWVDFSCAYEWRFCAAIEWSLSGSPSEARWKLGLALFNQTKKSLRCIEMNKWLH